MDLKTTSFIRKKNKIIKKLKEKFGEGVDEEEEDIPAQAPLALTQGQEKDQVEEVKIEEGVEGEEASEAPNKKKRKAKTPSISKPRKVAKPKPTVPSTRASIMDTTKKAQQENNVGMFKMGSVVLRGES